MIAKSTDSNPDCLNTGICPLYQSLCLVVIGSAHSMFDSNPLHHCLPERANKLRRAWSIPEHIAFLLGMEKYGHTYHGKWKNIALHFVKTRTIGSIKAHAEANFNYPQGKNSRGKKYVKGKKQLKLRVHDKSLRPV